MPPTPITQTLEHQADALAPASTLPTNYLNGPQSWTFLFTLLGVVAVCQIDRMLPFVLAESIKRDLGLSDTELGLVTGLAFAVCHSLMSLPIARAADHGSPRSVLSACILVWSAMTTLGGFATNFLTLALTRLGVALGEAGAIPTAHALIVRQISPERRGLAIGIFSMGIPLGTMLGFAIGGSVGDALGWRSALIGAGALGLVVLLLLLLVARPTPAPPKTGSRAEPFLQSSRRLLSSPAFLWLMIAAGFLGLASAPFYAFVTPFLIRTHGFTAGEAGLAFGVLQGLMGILGATTGGRGFDRAMKAGRGQFLKAPAIVFIISTITLLAALFVPTGWLSVALLVPTMFAFAFLLPWAFGTAHFVAGDGRQAQATSLTMMSSSLLGPAIGPLIVGMVSDAVTAAQIADGLRWGLILVPLASLLSGISLLIANRRVARLIGSR